MPAGRPTKYSEEMLAKAAHYLEHYSELGDMIPSIAGLAVELNVSRSTVKEWRSEDKPEFSAMLDKILATQERVLFAKGLSGDFNAAITKLALSKHGYADKQEVSGPEGGPVKIERIERIIVDSDK